MESFYNGLLQSLVLMKSSVASISWSKEEKEAVGRMIDTIYTLTVNQLDALENEH